MSNLEKRILEVERRYNTTGSFCVGTIISRCMMDHSLFDENGLDLAKATGNEASMVWCLAIGLTYEPKLFFYGHTIEEAVAKAEDEADLRRACS